jgi:uncharacterized membrane protein YkvA (DUF1232 family)
VKQQSLRSILGATTTPLASIFGSGFLVIVPILAATVGSWSVAAMAGICTLAYAVGWVIRHNIRHAEPLLAATPPEATLAFERGSDLALVLAYVVSVSLYLHIMSAFVLGGIGLDTGLNESLLATAAIAIIVVIGGICGLKKLETLEQWGLYITLFIVLLLIGGFAKYTLAAAGSAAGLILPKADTASAWETITVLAGTLIVVQGFETTRYLGEVYDARTRISASRWAQIIATVVYIVFVGFALPVVYNLHGQYDDNSLIQLAAFAAGILVIPLVVAAALSQFSAAVADTLAAAGNLEEVTHQHFKEKYAYLWIGGAAIALTWSADTYQLLAIASRSFAFYYLLQCLVGISVSNSRVQQCCMAVIAAILGFITIFAVPVG